MRSTIQEVHQFGVQYLRNMSLLQRRRMRRLVDLRRLKSIALTL
jgi:hypothetical protein